MRSYAVSAWACARPDIKLLVVIVERDRAFVAGAAGAAVTARHTASGRVLIDKAGAPGEPFHLFHRDA